MPGTTTSLMGLVFVASTAISCGDEGDDAAGDAGGAIQDPTDPALYRMPDGEQLAFGVKEGDLRNYFRRQGPAAVHLVARSGADPRLVAAFPANNQGIGGWFLDAGADTQLWAGAADDADIAEGGGVTAVVREQEGARSMNGVRATLHSNASSLTTYLTILANVRTVRDYGYGLCLENAAEFPELRNETVELIEEHNVVRVRREQIGGDHAMELLIKGVEGTTVSVVEQEVPPRPSCQAGDDGRQETTIEIAGEGGGLDFEVVALSDDVPLTPIDKTSLLTDTPPDSFELDALAFLSYAEKLEAGSWRFLTYFGRDTLLSIRMLMPGLKSTIVQAALSAVIERINLQPDVPDPNFDFIVEVGDVAHEEELGDFAAWKNSMQEPPPDDLRQPRYDYKMIDDDFLLAPVLVDYIDKVTAEDPAGAAAAIDTFLARERTDGASFREAVLANLELVLERARPFADDPAAPPDKKARLVALKNTVPVGQWRDSDSGIAFGRFPFDVNVGLVPGALAAAVTLFERLGLESDRAEAQRILDAWQEVDQLFRIDVPVSTVQANVAAYAAAVGVTDTSAQIQPEQGTMYSYDGIALDGSGEPLPVMHTDHGLVMEFARPSDEYLARTARTIVDDFPAGLMSPVGVMVANPALAAPETMVVDPNDLRDPGDDVPVKLQELFTSSQYHGTVVWSWQQAMLASGIRRQIERADELQPDTIDALLQAECKLWSTIRAAESVRAGELWSWAPNADAQPEYRAFGFNRSDVDESNAVQLWSTVYLVIKEPTLEQNPLCAAR